jgi:NSS family neurotransmitter:Na+ symporter
MRMAGYKEGKTRENWASRVGFILAAAGSAIGLGNIWRFPYMTGTNGGAVFVLIYLAVILIIGYPLMATEMALGRKSQRNAVGAFKKLVPNTLWWLVGALGVLSGFVILSYYSVVAGWAAAYIFKTLGGGLTANVDFGSVFGNHISAVGPSIFWHAVFMGATVTIIAAGVVKGIERCSEILMPLLGIALIILVVRSVTLSGAAAGIAFYLKPDFSAVTGRTLLNAISQAFFTLSLGMGCMITYGSYLRKEDEIPKSALQVVAMDTAVALLAGFAIFPAVFAMGFNPGAGPSLTFITLPAVFANMPLGSLFGALFFVLVVIAALTSAISLLEVVVAWLIDEKGWSRSKAAWLFGTLIFIAGIPTILGYSVLSEFRMPGLGTDILDTYDWFANSIFLPLGGLLTAIFAGHVWGAHKLQDEANLATSGFSLGNWYGFLVKYVVPVAIGILMLVGLYDTFIA